eukprot:s1774_g2.t1
MLSSSLLFDQWGAPLLLLLLASAAIQGSSLAEQLAIGGWLLPEDGFGAPDRMDESDDELFYSEPRLVTHIDDAAIRLSTQGLVQRAMACFLALFALLLFRAASQMAQTEACLATGEQPLLLQIGRKVELNMATSSCARSSNIDIAALQVLQESLRHQAPSNVGADVASVLSYVSGQVESEYAKIADDEIIIGEEDGSWLTRLEKIGEAVVLTAVDEIPVVGGVLSNLLSLIWPSSDDEYDIWALIIGEVKELVDVAILEFELSEREGDFLGLRRDLTRYTRANTDTEKGNDLTVALAKVEDLILGIRSNVVNMYSW